MITSKQCKAARIMLGWNAKDLALSSGINASSISRFERDSMIPNAESISAIERAFMRSGIKFIKNRGIDLQDNFSEILEGEDCVSMLWQRIIESFQGTKGGEVLITNVDEKRALEKSNADLRFHLKDLEKRNITERLLSCEGDTTFLVAPKCYRWITKEAFNLGRSTYIFNGCLAIQLWHSNIIIFVRNFEAYMAEKERFEELWSNAIVPQVSAEGSKFD